MESLSKDDTTPGEGQVDYKFFQSDEIEFILQHKSCMNFVVGFDYIETALTKIVQQYIDFFNDRYDGKRQTP